MLLHLISITSFITATVAVGVTCVDIPANPSPYLIADCLELAQAIWQ